MGPLPSLALALAVLPAAAARAEEDLPYPDVAEVAHANAEAVTLAHALFSAKTRADPAATMAFFSPELATYSDATFGLDLDRATLEGLFAQAMPSWDDGMSYPTRILGEVAEDDGSLVVAFTDTPELFADEIRAVGVVDVRDGLVVRWVDYWDSSSYDEAVYRDQRTPDDAFPTDFKETEVGEAATPGIEAAAGALQAALAAGDAGAAAALFSPDAAYEDVALRTQVLGRLDIEGYLGRVLADAPYGAGSRLCHVAGGPVGGGFEWLSASGTPGDGVAFGVTALELDAAGLITRATTVYDGRQLAAEDRAALAAAALEP